jgi:flagellar biosynthesis/type III secretory pathway protein FliH
VREEARSAGFAEGYAAGQAEARAQLEPAATAIGEALTGLRELHARAADSVERHAVDLAIQVAEKVVAGALEVGPERVLDVVRGALHAIVERERVVVLVNPDDLELVRASADDLAGSLGGMEALEIQQERRVPRGGALLRTAVGEVDARISTKLEKARTVIEAELGG